MQTEQRIGRKGHNLTNLSIKIDQTKNITNGDIQDNDIHNEAQKSVYKQKTERNNKNKTSLTNL